MIINTKREKKLPQMEMIELLLHYDVISFDIFDTLILRTCSKPIDVYKIVGMKQHLVNLSAVRVMASQQTRKMTETGEVTIKEIYDYVHKLTNIDPQKGADLEFEIDKQLCRANKYFTHVLDVLKAANKKVIITSDMYYSKAMLTELLANCGITQFDELYVSCEYNKSKKNRELFQMLAEKYAGLKVIHIGDNYQDDVRGANSVEWDAYYYEKVSIKNSPKLNYPISQLVRSTFAACISNRFYNGLYPVPLPQKQKIYYYGYVHAGLLALGYVNWIHEKVERQGIDKILFLSRDCDVLYKLYNTYYPDGRAEYVHWSRYAGIMTGIEYDMLYFFFQLMDRNVVKDENMTIADYFKKQHIEGLISKLPEYDLNPDDLLYKSDTTELVKQFLIKNAAYLKEQHQPYKDAAKAYFDPILKDSKKALVVDIGWRGSGIMSLKKLIEEEWQYPCTVLGAMVGNYAFRAKYDTSMLQNGDIDVYTFSENNNTDIASSHQKHTELENSMIETLFSSAEPSFLYYYFDEEKKVQLAFSTLSGNPEYVELIQQGILDFASDYMEYTKDLKELRNITGRDAYGPILRLTASPNGFQRTFSDYNFNLAVGEVTNNKEMKTLDQIVKYDSKWTKYV